MQTTGAFVTTNCFGIYFLQNKTTTTLIQTISTYAMYVDC